MFFDFHTHTLPEKDSVKAVVSSPFPPSSCKYWSIEAHPWNDYLHPDFAAAAAGAAAIGETGIDKVRGVETALQLRRFHLCCQTAERLDKPLILHEVRAAADCAAILRQYTIRAVLRHGWRTPKIDKLETALQAGWFIGCSINTPESIWEYFRKYPESRKFMALETDDAPPDTLPILYAKAAEKLRITRDELSGIMENNFNNFLGLK